MFENTRFVLFSHRLKLGMAFEEYAEKNHMLKCWDGFVAFLQSNGMLNEEAARDYLERWEMAMDKADDLISRKAAIEACIEVSKQEEEHSKMWATGLRYAKRILTEIPSVPAVPLDKLCEFLADTLHTPAPCFNNEEICPRMDFGYCRLPDAPDVKECWKKILTKFMEELEE